MIAYDGWIYFASDEDNKRLYKMRRDGSGKQKLSDDACISIGVSGDWVYYIDFTQHHTNRICRVRTDGSRKQFLNDEDCANLRVEGDWLYYDIVRYDDIDSKDEYYPHKMRTDGTENQKVRESTLADRMDDQAKGIVSQVNPETEEYFAKLAERLGLNTDGKKD